jgi:beta-RFAP synthase
MTRIVNLSSPSRLHFGLFSIGADASERRFGGMGLMVESPRTEIEVSASESFAIEGPESATCRQAIELCLERLSHTIQASELISGSIESVKDLPISLKIKSAPPRHSGLGSGTQLALCTTAAMINYLGLPTPGPEELSSACGRGKRSAIGSYGFFQGGLLVDRGKTADEIAPLDFRADFPEHWPVVLVMQRESAGLSGEGEMAAFGQLPAVTEQQRNKMIGLVREEIIPSVLNEDYKSFGEAVYQFGHQSGMFFESVQGGPYNGKVVTELVRFIRQSGVPAVGQTSWGPCVFAIAGNIEQAHELISKVQNHYGDQFEIILTKADNTGARANDQCSPNNSI